MGTRAREQEAPTACTACCATVATLHWQQCRLDILKHNLGPRGDAITSGFLRGRAIVLIMCARHLPRSTPYSMNAYYRVSARFRAGSSVLFVPVASAVYAQ